MTISFSPTGHVNNIGIGAKMQGTLNEKTVSSPLSCECILLVDDRRDAICAMSLDCWLTNAWMPLVYTVGAINSIVIMTRNDKYSPASKAGF